MTSESLPMQVPVLAVAGDGRVRGRMHGEALRPLVHEHLGRYLEAIAQELGLDPRQYLRDLVRDTNFLPAIERWAPDLLAELRGIAEGAAADFDLVFARALSDEEPWYRRSRQLRHASAKGCTSLALAAAGERPAIVAQNMDTPKWWDGTQLVVRVTDRDGFSALVFTVAGKISLCGVNEAGLAVCCNTVYQLDHSRHGLPEDFVVRGFLARRTWEEGLAFLAGVHHASGQNYTIGAPGRGPLNVECSAGGVAIEQLTPGRSTLIHTNHALRNPDQELYRRDSAGLAPGQLRDWFGGTTHERWQALEQACQRHEPASVADAQALLASHAGPICRHGQVDGRRDQFTLGCLVMELRAPGPLLHVAPGPPCLTPFTTLGFT